METKFPSDEELQAFIDGELDDARIDAIAEMIAASPSLAEQVERFQSDKDLIARVYGPLAEHPLPASLIDAVQRGPKVAVLRRPGNVIRAALAIAATIVLAWVGYPMVARLTTDPLVAQAVAVRSGDIRPDQEVSPATLASAPALDQFADVALAVPIKVPNLEKSGYVLTAVAAYPDRENRHAIQVSYRGPRGEVFTMYIRPSKGPDRFELSRRADLQVCIWQNDNLSVVMLGTMPARDMLRVATSTYADLDF